MKLYSYSLAGPFLGSCLAQSTDCGWASTCSMSQRSPSSSPSWCTLGRSQSTPKPRRRAGRCSPGSHHSEQSPEEAVGESQCGLWQTLLTLSSTATWPHVPVWGSAEGPPAASFRSMVAGSGGKGENGGKDLCVTFPSNTFHLHAARSNSGKDHRGFVYFCLSPAHLCRFGPPH